METKAEFVPCSKGHMHTVYNVREAGGMNAHLVSSAEHNGRFHLSLDLSCACPARGGCHHIEVGRNSDRLPGMRATGMTTDEINAQFIQEYRDAAARKVPARPTLRERLAEPVGTGKGLYG